MKTDSQLSFGLSLTLSILVVSSKHFSYLPWQGVKPFCINKACEESDLD